jgi:hypothetical protein
MKGATMGLSSDSRTLMNRGRKAGLTTRELYSALGSRPGEGSDAGGRADANGYVSIVNEHGLRVYRPLGSRRAI